MATPVKRLPTSSPSPEKKRKLGELPSEVLVIKKKADTPLIVLYNPAPAQVKSKKSRSSPVPKATKAPPGGYLQLDKHISQDPELGRIKSAYTEIIRGRPKVVPPPEEKPTPSPKKPTQITQTSQTTQTTVTYVQKRPKQTQTPNRSPNSNNGNTVVHVSKPQSKTPNGKSTSRPTSTPPMKYSERKPTASCEKLTPHRSSQPSKVQQRPIHLVESDSESDSDLDSFIEDDDENFDYSRAIRKISGYDRRRYAHESYRDDYNMEATREDIAREEQRSKRLGALEDQLEEEAERRHREMKLAKKR